MNSSANSAFPTSSVTMCKEGFVNSDDLHTCTVPELVPECNIKTYGIDNSGTATVSGFEPNKTYKFHEVAAPEGYKVNPNDVTAEWKPDQADDAQIAEAVMHDSKLSLLPYTGGKGTAAFTIFGVILMGAAVSIYCVIKKNKSVK